MLAVDKALNLTIFIYIYLVFIVLIHEPFFFRTRIIFEHNGFTQKNKIGFQQVINYFNLINLQNELGNIESDKNIIYYVYSLFNIHFFRTLSYKTSSYPLYLYSRL